MRMRRLLALALTPPLLSGTLATLAPAAPATAAPRPQVYTLPGDPAGTSRFEGIGYDKRTGDFYVSEVTGGEISRGNVTDPTAEPFLGGGGTDGRFTARGIEVDDEGRIYIAGGPNASDNEGAPDFWVYSRSGELLAALRTGVEGAFLNDIAIGKDGAAYITNSNTPQIFRVTEREGEWRIELWLDASDVVERRTGFNLGGIVATPDGRYLLVAQGNEGKLFRVEIATREVTEVEVSGGSLANADGLVLRGHRLTAVRNFSRRLTTLQLSGRWTSARVVQDRATDPERVLTTAEIARGRLLAVDSEFNGAERPYEVVSLRLPRGR